jgi:hypothetical protein
MVHMLGVRGPSGRGLLVLHNSLYNGYYWGASLLPSDVTAHLHVLTRYLVFEHY